jgi:lambda repressor-like predicted transcriptional regulator
MSSKGIILPNVRSAASHMLSGGYVSAKATISFAIPANIDPRKWREIVCRGAIKARYGTITAFAKEAGISRQMLYAVISRAHRSRHVESLLAEVTGYSTETLFAEDAA